MPQTADSKRKEFLNWSKKDPQKAAEDVWAKVREHEGCFGWRHQMAQRGALAYSGLGVGELFQNMPFDGPHDGRKRKGRRRAHGGWGDKSREQHARAMVETVIEKLFGLDQPKPQLVATDAEYEVRRQGVWADRFVEGTYHLSHGNYSDFWDMARQAALLAYCSTGTSAIRTEPDYVAKRVRSRLRSTLNTFVDPADVGADKPLSYFDVTWESPEYMCEDTRFKGKEDQIWRAATVPLHMSSGRLDCATFRTPMVKVVTAWRMPFGTFKGRKAVFVSNSDSSAGSDWLYWDEWEHPEPELSFLHCSRSIVDDFWGENMIEIALDPLRDAEQVDEKARTTMEQTSQTYISLDGKTAAPKGITDAKDVNVIRYDSKKGEGKPDITKPGILNGDYFDYQLRKIGVAHELLGISMMHQAGEVQGASGNRSGKSIRLEASLLPERFARKLRMWRDFVAVSCAQNTIRAAQSVGKVEPNWQVRWPGVNFDAQVKVDVLKIDLNCYTLQFYAVSEQKNTPADRASAAQEMFDRGEISAEQLQVINEGLYDTKKETKASIAERSYVASVTDQMLYGDPKLVGDERRYMATEYIPPMPWYDPDAMLAQASPIFTQALIDKVPQNRRSLLRRFMEDIWALRQQQQREVAMANASVSLSARTADPFAGMGASAVPQLPGDPALGQPALPPPPPGTPGLGGPTPAALLGAPAAQPAGAPSLNAPGSPGLV